MKSFIYFTTIIFFTFFSNMTYCQRLIEYKGVNIYSSSQNPNQNILNWAFETIDTISNFKKWLNHSNPEINYFEMVKYIDKVFINTNMSSYPNVLIKLNCNVSHDWPCGPMILVVKFPSEKSAKDNKCNIYRYYKHDWFDIATPYMICTTKGNYLRLILFSGDIPELPVEMLSYFRVTNI